MTNDFARLGLPKPLAYALTKRGITEPFPVQTLTIPDAMLGKDVSGRAPTGSGKTLAFGLPLLANVRKAKKGRPTALILAPTRELAEQINVDLSPLAQTVERRVAAVYGGVAYGPQKAALRNAADVLVATPGRLEDLIEQRVVDLGDVHIAVVDEADRMADMGFMPAVRRILDQTSDRRQTMLFSATLDGDVAELSRRYQRKPVRHEADAVVTSQTDARHHFWLIEHEHRVVHAADAVRTADRSIVFTRTRRGADRLAKQLTGLGVNAVPMHGGLSQNKRKRALGGFAAGRSSALVATDVAARGIHVDDVDAVIHFDPPADHKDYVHRSGRTARAGATGTVVSLVSRDQRRAVRRIQQALDMDEPIAEPKTLTIGRADQLNHDRAAQEKTHSTNRRTKQDREGGRNEKAAQSVYVGNLPWATNADELKRLFQPHGRVYGTSIMKSRHSGRSRGFGFVEMPQHAAVAAIEALNGATLGGRNLTVRRARPVARNR